jgi:gas vesicle protein
MNIDEKILDFLKRGERANRQGGEGIAFPTGENDNIFNLPRPEKKKKMTKTGKMFSQMKQAPRQQRMSETSSVSMERAGTQIGQGVKMTVGTEAICTNPEKGENKRKKKFRKRNKMPQQKLTIPENIEDKYLKENVKIRWNDFSPETRKAINKLEKEFKGVNRLSELLDDVVENVWNDAYEDAWDRAGGNNDPDEFDYINQ